MSDSTNNSANSHHRPASAEREEWYREAFGADYLKRYPHRDEEEGRRAVASLVEPLGLPAGARVLDLCCGAGRHAAPLKHIGLRVTGLDLSAELLEEAAALLPPTEVHWVRGDMRILPFRDRCFSLVVNFFTAFGYFQAERENSQVLQEVHRVLEPGGWFLLDFLNKSLVLAEFAGRKEFSVSVSLPDGRACAVTKRLVGDRIEKVTVFPGVEGRRVESLRLYSSDELAGLVTGAGFALEREFGDYDGGAFSFDSSARYIALCRRTG